MGAPVRMQAYKNALVFIFITMFLLAGGGCGSDALDKLLGKNGGDQGSSCVQSAKPQPATSGSLNLPATEIPGKYGSARFKGDVRNSEHNLPTRTAFAPTFAQGWNISSAELTHGGSHFGAWKMSDGKYLVITVGKFMAPEYYDAEADTWTAKTTFGDPMSSVYYTSACRLVGTEKILLVPDSLGEYEGYIEPQPSMLYDYSADTWTPTGKLNQGRYWFDTVCLNDGRAMVVGGKLVKDQMSQLYLPTAETEIFDPATGTWASSETMNYRRVWHTSTRLDDGRILVAGGMDNESGQVDPNGEYTSEIYDPETECWTMAGNLNQGRTRAVALKLTDGRVMVAGGELKHTDNYLSSVEIFDPAVGTWSKVADLTMNRTDFVMLQLKNGRVMVVDGIYQLSDYRTTVDSAGAVVWYVMISVNQILAEAEVYDFATNTWTEILPEPNYWRIYHFGVVLDNGNVLIGGGWDTAETWYTKTEIYVP